MLLIRCPYCEQDLPEPEFAVAALVEPTSPIEEIISGVMAEVLGVDRVGITDSFFEIGGNSLVAVRLIGMVDDELGVRLSLPELIASPTPRELARSLAARSPAATASACSRTGGQPACVGSRPAEVCGA